MQLPETSRISSVVVAGGQASRIGGIDKTLLPLGITGGPLLVEVIESCPGEVFVVGKPRQIDLKVTWVADLVEAGGPAAGIWAGLKAVNTEYVFVTAADQQLTREITELICANAYGQDGAWAIRPDGQGQPLLACVRTELLRTLLTKTQGVNDSPLRILQQLNMVGVKVDSTHLRDVDTWSDAAKILKEQKMSEVTPIWLTHVASILGISETEIPVEELLDLTREVAHNIERKSAPLTTFLIGLAVGKTGADPKVLMAQVSAAVSEWTVDE